MSPGPEKQFDTDEVLERAVQVFWARGYEGTSLSALTTAMGIGKKSLYDTYGNKRSLFLKVVAKYTQLMVTDLRERLQREGSPLENLRRLLSELESGYAEPGSHGCLLGTNAADFDTDDREVAESIRKNLGRIEEAFFEVLSRAADQGELKGGTDPRDLARMLMCLTQGAALIGRVVEEGTIPNSAFASALTLLEV